MVTVNTNASAQEIVEPCNIFAKKEKEKKKGWEEHSS